MAERGLNSQSLFIIYYYMEDLVQKVLPLLQNVKTLDADLLKNVVKTLSESVSAEQKGLVLEALREAVKRWQQETKGALPFELEATFDIVVDTVFSELPTVEAVLKSSFVQKLLALFCAHCCSASAVAVEVATVASVDEVVAVAGEAVTVAAEAATVAAEAVTVVPEVVAVAAEAATVVPEVVAVVAEVATVVPETPVASLIKVVEVSTTVAPVPLSQVKDLDVVLTSVLEPEMASRRLSMRSQRRQYN